MVLIIDNYDSFTYNLVQYFGELGAQVEVRRNDQVTVPEIESLGCRHLVISPGPGEPRHAGVSGEAIRRLAGRLPILGVCLGHQAIGEVFGGRVVRGPAPVHGKPAIIHHDGRTLFSGVPQEFCAGRYHSLIVERESLPECLEVSATSPDGLIMGLRHREWPVEGVQFHPESVLTEHGKTLLQNFLQL